MKKMQKLFCVLLLLVLFIPCFTLPGQAAIYDYIMMDGIVYPVVELSIDGKRVMEKDALLIDGVTMVPLRAACNAFGKNEGTVTWDAKTTTGGYESDELLISAVYGRNYLTANKRCLYSDAAITILNGTMYVPIRSLANAFGAQIEWDGSRRAADMITTGKVIESGDTFYNQKDLLWLARIINAECRYEPLLGQVAVANVVLNRVKSPYFPNTVYEVLFDNRYGKTQFYDVNDPRIYSSPIETSYDAAKIALEGYVVSDEILYYMNPKLSTTMWMMTSCTYITTIGLHSFYGA